MAKYNSVLYGQSVYGQKSRLAFSVEPFSSVSLDYTTVELNWTPPVGGYSAFRLLRNQEGYSETVEDGVVIYEEFGIDVDDLGSPLTTGSVAISTLEDKAAVGVPSLVGGKFAYYRVWLLKTADKVWYPAGDTFVLIPSAHPTYGPNKLVLLTTHEKFMNLLPRVYTSVSHSPIDEVNADSDIYRFLQGFSFTTDEFLTATDALIPDHSGSKTSPTIIGSQAAQLGLTLEPTIAIRNQKRMIREALYMYARKGTIIGLNTLVESLTGYDSTITISKNLLLTPEDSSFYKGLGFWLPIGSCALTLEDVNPVTSESLTIDRVYSAKVVVSTALAAVTNGEDYPITHGIPVDEEVEYTLSLYSQVDVTTATGSILPTVTWYDQVGQVISSTVGASMAVTTVWDGTQAVATAPVGAVYASIRFTFETTGTYYLDMVQLAESSVTSFSEARSVNVLLNPSKTNYLSNPSFEVNNATWSVNSGTVTYEVTDVPKYVLVGDTVLQTSTGAVDLSSEVSQGIAKVDTYQSFSVYARTLTDVDTVTLAVEATTGVPVSYPQVISNVATVFAPFGHPITVGTEITISGFGAPFDGVHTVTGVINTAITFDLVNADLAAVDVTGLASFSVLTSSVFEIGTEWSRGQVNLYVPPTYLQENTSYVVSITGTFTNTVQFDGAQFESSYLATDYFDGDYGTERDALWDATPHESPSYVYPNKLVNVSRLAEEIVNFIPFDTPWVISSESGIEASGIS